MGGDDFCLRWNDHHSIFFSSVEDLCNRELLTDVTLSCGSENFSAHRLVLSVCSGYFAGLFSRKNGLPRTEHVVVYLKDIEARHMELLLRYMYRGEIYVEESELEGFLTTAKSLQVKGLSEQEEEGGGSANSTVVPEKRKMPGDSHALKKIKEEESQQIEAGPSGTDMDYVVDEEAPEMYEGPDDIVGSDQMNPAFFPDTFRRGRFPGGIEAVRMLGPGKYGCAYCTKVFPNQYKLDRHYRSHTGEKPFTCTVCGFASAFKHNLKTHCVSRHKMTDEQFLAEVVPLFPHSS